MITKREMMDFAREFGLEPNIVEKDYVLGWVLAGIANHAELMNQWIFKGGTCLKKCYFGRYRFSEDLDYTLMDEAQLNVEFLTGSFTQIVTWIYDVTGIEIPVNAIRFEIYKNNFGEVSVEGRLYYVGPLQRRSNQARIKLDLTADELLVATPILRAVQHPYSDQPRNGIQANCYNFAEMFAEKLRALSERARPRDLYDVIHLYRHAVSLNIKPTIIFEILQKKCEYKAIPVPTMQYLESHHKLQELKSEWASMLTHQLPALPPIEQFWQELPELVMWLHSEISIVE